MTGGRALPPRDVALVHRVLAHHRLISEEELSKYVTMHMNILKLLSIMWYYWPK
jgi:hypothetical protein